jgi:hypothetical protein
MALGGRNHPRKVAAMLAIGACILTPVGARAYVDPGWTHDHSSAGVPPRPSGYSGLVATFGQPCSSAANDSRSYWPSQSARNVDGYVYYHPHIARDVGYNIRNHVFFDRRDGAVDYLVGGYNCRPIRGETSWSTHAFGAAIDTNSARNPLGQDHWVGIGADGVAYGTYLPDVWRGAYPGHRFFWGLNWDSRPDPMHFQYVTDY